MRKWIIALSILTIAGTSDGGVKYAGPDADAIRKAAMDYCESWYTGDAERMENCLHPELAKRIIRKDEKGRSRLDNMGAMTLVQYTRAAWGPKTPKDQQQKEVMILDVYGNVASAKAVMAGWIDYLHLAKIDGEWKIVNVLWEVKPKAGEN
ncbi:MAG: nuclear transport factor 2 family protein [bacterium]|nr:nuclear transport factor 2 family protein [bacterium]